MEPLRLESCGDLLDVAEYTRWAKNKTAAATYKQIERGTCLVSPHTLKPRPMWRRSDLEARLGDEKLMIRQRAARARKKLAVAS